MYRWLTSVWIEWQLLSKQSANISLEPLKIAENVVGREQNRVQQMVYVAYICTPIFIGIQIVLDVRMFTCLLIFSLWLFKVFNNFLLFKHQLYIWHLIYLFVLGRKRFFTVYICFKESLFFNFLYKLFNNYISSYIRALANLGCQ